MRVNFHNLSGWKKKSTVKTHVVSVFLLFSICLSVPSNLIHLLGH